MNKSNRIILLIACLAIFGMLAACQSKATNPTVKTELPAQKLPDTPEPTQPGLTTAVPTLAPMPGTEEIRTAIINALLTLNDKPNRMESTIVLSDGGTFKNVIEFIPPDRKHIVSVDGGGEYIIVGEKVYAKTNTSGKWEETQVPASTFMGDGKKGTAQTAGEGVSEVKWLRKDTLNNKAVIVYSYFSTTKANDVELHSQTELWVGEMDGLPYKMIVDGEIYSTSTDDLASGETKKEAVKALTTTLITFDPTISIEPPM